MPDLQPAQSRLAHGARQVVEVVVDRGYHPDAIVARAGVPLRLVFRRQDADACTERVVFSSPRIDRRLAATGATTIELPAQPPGEVRFTCGMGRYSGRIKLIAERTPSIQGRLRNRVSRLRTPVGTALVLWICTLPLIALLGFLALDVIGAIASAGAALFASLAVFLWASGRAPEPR